MIRTIKVSEFPTTEVGYISFLYSDTETEGMGPYMDTLPVAAAFSYNDWEKSASLTKKQPMRTTTIHSVGGELNDRDDEMEVGTTLYIEDERLGSDYSVKVTRDGIVSTQENSLVFEDSAHAEIYAGLFTEAAHALRVLRQIRPNKTQVQ